MEKRTKRVRGSNWNHAQTMALAELKREASLHNEDGRLVWERIAHTLSSRFPGQNRTSAQCRRRWDTLVKVYNHIEEYCVVTGQDHRELDEGELASMELATAYQQDWYDVVEHVCSRRKRKESCDCDLRLAKRSKGSSPGSHYFELPERPDSLGSASISKSVNYYEQSTPESITTYAQVSLSPTLETDKLSPEEEVPRLKKGNDGLVLEATQLRQHGQDSDEVSQRSQTLESVNQLPHTFPAEDGAQLKEPLQDYLWDLVDAMPLETSVEIEQPDTKSELTVPLYWDLELVELVAQPKEPPQGHVRDDSLKTANTSDASDASDDRNAWNFWKVLYTRNASVASSSSSGVTLFSEPPVLSSAIMTSSISSRSADSTTSRQSRRWSLKVIVLKVRQCCHSCGRKERTEDIEMESKQATPLEEKPRKEALLSREENVPVMLNAASSSSAASATRGDKPLQKHTERISKQAALHKKEEETRSCKVERQQLGGKSSGKCVPMSKLCAKLGRKLFPAFHGQSSH